MHNGIGREVNPLDGDEIVVKLGVRDGRIATIGVDGIRSGIVTYVGGQTRSVWFATGTEARAFGGETFAGCETARHAALVLRKVFIGREIDTALALDGTHVITKMPAEHRQNERCVDAVIRAVRKALIDLQTRVLAEAVVEVRSLR